MSDFIFAEGQYVHGLWIVAAFTLLLVGLDRRGAAILERFASRVMLTRLVRRPSGGRRLLRIAFLSLAGVFAVGALMRPQWGLEYVETPRAGTELMICLDVSKSMLARDAAPNRLERAKAEIIDLLAFLEGDHVGLTAFAGKAAVLCPLTPDFGFFRLVLDEAGPQSVGLGGTRLAEAIRTATAGFGETADVSRALLLITDGEEHDDLARESALKAAEEAANVGIQIIAIGFGDEVEGSEIVVTDRKTGAESPLRDADGNVVRTKLDGDLLRDLTLNRGAYIPAGTGVLDLESIYNQRLAPLTRGKLDGRGRQVRKEGYQWAVLLALLSLVGSVFVGSRIPRRIDPARLGGATVPPARAAVLAFGVGLSLLFGSLDAKVAGAQSSTSQPVSTGQPASTQTSDDEPEDAGDNSADDSAADAPEPEPLPDDAREAYNLGLAAFRSGALETAEEHFSHARAQAGIDVDARFHATYNLAWTHVKRADTLLEETPEEALTSLETAVDWFRAAVRIRPADDRARHNLEVVMARVLVLRDELTPKDERDYHQRLDELIERARGLLQGTLPLIDAATADDPVATETLRSRFRSLGKDTRVLTSDLGVLAKDASEEKAAIEAKSEEERTAEDNVRSVQIDNMLYYLNSASQRLNQARRQLRLSSAEPGFRRSALAIGELKRARDQWRNPAELLTTLIHETQELGQLTAARGSSLVAPELSADTAPAWLSDEFLVETQTVLDGRTGELHQRLKTAIESPEAAAPPPDDPQARAQYEEQQKVLAQIREAEPFVSSAKSSFESALASLEEGAPLPAVTHQNAALIALNQALERFADLRRLIETSYRLQKSIETTLEESGMELPNGERVPLDQLLGTLRESQRNNLERADRIAGMIEDKLTELAAQPAATPPGAPPVDPAQDPQAIEKQRHEAAQQLIVLAKSAMELTEQWLAKPLEDPSVSLDREAALETSQRAVARLEELRRLFFSLIEHLKETAYRESQVLDETREVAGLLAATQPDTPEREESLRQLGPLVPRQQELSVIAGEIARALEQQAKSPAGGQTPGQPAPDPEQLAKLARAAELVDAAAAELVGAHEAMGPPPPSTEPDLDLATKKQETALQQLIEAITLLEPPQPQEQDQNQQQQENEQQESQPEESEGQEEQRDVEELLQAIRDREAERRKEKAERTDGAVQQVEKDW